MPRTYSAPFDAVAVGTAAQDLWEVTPADDKPIAIIGCHISNVGVAADAADAQEELVSIRFYRGFTTSGSGGSTVTPNPLGFSGDTASGATVEINNTTVATTSGTIVGSYGWNVRVPFDLWLPQEAWIGASQANTTFVVRSASTLTDAITCSGTLYFIEYP
jgi:hypothetical protein